MAHTCPQCGGFYNKPLVVGERRHKRFASNNHYRHVRRSWKHYFRQRHQWEHNAPELICDDYIPEYILYED